MCVYSLTPLERFQIILIHINFIMKKIIRFHNELKSNLSMIELNGGNILSLLILFHLTFMLPLISLDVQAH